MKNNRMLMFLVLLGSGVALNATIKTKNGLDDIKVEDLPTKGAVSAVKMHGRVHEVEEALKDVVEALLSDDCDLAKTHAEKAHKLAQRASTLTGVSARSKVRVENVKAETDKQYDAVKKSTPHPDNK